MFQEIEESTLPMEVKTVSARFCASQWGCLWHYFCGPWRHFEFAAPTLMLCADAV